MTQMHSIPTVTDVPSHVAIIMDGNGRWATERHLPRTAGHIRGVRAVRRAVEYCVRHHIAYLTLFAFSSENWRRPPEEVGLLMKLFVKSLQKEVSKLHKNNIRLRVIGDLSAFSSELQTLIHAAEQQTIKNTGLTLNIAANYGGRWDILQAMRRMIQERPELLNAEIEASDFEPFLSMADMPEPDLFIRTGGERRISNFMIWQLAYTELFFSDKYWPDFSAADFDEALAWYAQRERRFGRTSAQLQET
ncbi:polyprenyl diphosphate synthase [Pelistega europaea]|uniref:Isoprenyl transferase n=1 Tax=Pelistega europaea TaxID=106147 RepID=A0A7Y4L8P0_9BURK|nr:polyprenyl diphosphate synthase [Pelistega europaea]NOL48977.1 di-trans,poly-cis-decaprenylcistransferase [Pelistega europaea]